LKPFETILTIQIVLLQIKATLVHTTLVVLDLQLILMDKPVLASASGLDITHTYRIKLVIADGGNVNNDSAIFLEANSFNIGQDVLGLDYTVANSRAICPSTILPILTATDLPIGTTFVWKTASRFHQHKQPF
jgi:hypothetical protein